MLNFDWLNLIVDHVLVRLLLNTGFTAIIIFYTYSQKNNCRNYSFTYYTIGIVVFFLCFSINKLDIDTGMGIGLFAIFGIIRYRTSTIPIKEMTYLFAVIGLSIINALTVNALSVLELLFINAFISLSVCIFDFFWLPQVQVSKTTVVKPLSQFPSFEYDTVKSKLSQDTGLKICSIHIEKINYDNKTVCFTINYTL